MTDTNKKEVYAKFRLSVDNTYRNEYSYVDYRRWGILEVWSAGRIKTHALVIPTVGIEVWLDYRLIHTFKDYGSALKKISELKQLAPVNLDDLWCYLEIDK